MSDYLDEDLDEDMYDQTGLLILQIERDISTITAERELGEITEDAFQLTKKYMEEYLAILEG